MAMGLLETVPSWAKPVLATAVPLVLGFLIGGIVRTALKFFVALVAVLAIAPYLGYESLPTMGEFISMAREGFGLGREIFGWLPLHSGFFIVGVAIGFWFMG